MATPLTYAFNRDRLLALINRPGCETVVFSLVNLVKKPETEAYMYIYAQAHDKSGDPILSQGILPDGEEGCPVPPGWKCDIEPPSITQSQLELTPRFALSKAALFPLVDQNELKLDGVNEKQETELMNQVLAYLDAEIAEEGMEPFLSLTCQHQNGTYKLPAQKAHAYTASLKTVAATSHSTSKPASKPIE